jgi:hypothetical protein
MGVEEVGCCGAYCGTCRAYKDNTCLGCKIGYQDGNRDISRAKCKIKICCIEKGYLSCADCSDYNSCTIIQSFLGKNGYKYKKYKEALDFIIANGYEEFIEIADTWKMQYGKYKKK